MNTAILVALLAVGAATSFVAASPALLAPAVEPTCTDLAGQGVVCTDVREDGADVSFEVAPTIPPVAAANAAPVCQDLAGQGFVCADVRQDGFDIEAELAPTVPPLPPLPPV